MHASRRNRGPQWAKIETLASAAPPTPGARDSCIHSDILRFKVLGARTTVTSEALSKLAGRVTILAHRLALPTLTTCTA